VTPAGLQERFETTKGRDPIFRTNDGSNSPLADVSTVAARRAAYSMLLTKGLIRVGLPVPANAEFDLIAVNDPYGFASSQELSLFRRPLPSTNLAFLSTVMWDGRETLQKGSAAAIHFDFDNQANDATQGHAQRPHPIDQATREQIYSTRCASTRPRSSTAQQASFMRMGPTVAPRDSPGNYSSSGKTT